MPPQPTNPQTTNDNSLPRKRQALLDDNGEPVSLPASKKKKSAEQTGPKKKVPTKPQVKPKGKGTVSKTVSNAPAKIKPSVEVEEVAVANGPEAPLTVEYSDDEDVNMIPEENEEKDEAELGPYLFFILSEFRTKNRYRTDVKEMELACLCVL